MYTEPEGDKLVIIVIVVADSVCSLLQNNNNYASCRMRFRGKRVNNKKRGKHKTDIKRFFFFCVTSTHVRIGQRLRCGIDDDIVNSALGKVG